MTFEVTIVYVSDSGCHNYRRMVKCDSCQDAIDNVCLQHAQDGRYESSGDGDNICEIHCKQI